MDSNKKPASPENGGNRFNGFWIYGVIILTFLGLSLSSMKKRGGLGVNLAIGIALAFVFIFSFENESVA